MLVSGTPGVGKTTFAGELAALLRRVAAHSEIAADRVQANYRQRRSGASGVVSARAGAA